jgi:hypothetical protein
MAATAWPTPPNRSPAAYRTPKFLPDPLAKPEAFCSFDVETDGDNPMMYSMRSIGLALYEGRDHTLVDQLYITISPQEDQEGVPFAPDPHTMREFWDKHPEQWRDVNTSTVSPQEAMASLAQWLHRHYETFLVKFVARPANFDWMWLKCYYEKYGPPKKPKIGYFCHDLSALMRAYQKCHGVQDKKKFMNQLSREAPYTHNALDDAVCQGRMYMSLRTLLDRDANHHVSPEDKRT